ncbi:hypothetical protein [Mesorhizobium australicum]|uniref:Anti-sigma factor n=1 Tax=Mesorhizobium australicum TaxID=536018 RepID=A0A1X7NG16_9HYPH|nr:hypothetical protein [Mesorhizobium australicum]SMH36275.1 hypothetical protein SAMN02982922_1725 [Mesorhizobium australicum]
MFGQPKEDMRVADYVLGLMDTEETTFFEREMRQDPALAARVADWRERIARMDDAEPETPHAQMRRRIEDGLRRRGDNVIALPTAFRERTEARPELSGWPIVGAACFAVGILFGGFCVWLLFV